MGLSRKEQDELSFIDNELGDLEAELEELLIEEEYEACEESLYNFVRLGWQHADPAPFKPSPHIEIICEHVQACIEGDSQLKNLVINVPPRSGKPLDENTLVLMSNGERKKIKDIEVGELVISHKGRPQVVTAKLHQGLLPSVEIKTQYGRSVVAAYDHPFLTPEGWVDAANLKIGQSLGYITRPILNLKSETKVEEHKLAGYFIGDGSTGHNNAGFTSADEITIEDFIQSCKLLGFNAEVKAKCINSTTKLEGKAYRIAAKSGVRNWLRQTDISGKVSANKVVPDFVYTSELEKTAYFIATYFSCDGTVCLKGETKDGKKRPDRQIQITSISKDLLLGVQHLLLRYGIRSRVTHRDVKYIDRLISAYNLDIITQDDKIRFYEQIPVPGIKSSKDRLGAFNGRLFNEFESNIHSDKIVSIEPVGERNCYCIQVETDNTYTANDLICHNSKVVSVFTPAWVWGCAGKPEEKFITASHSERLATDLVVNSRNLMQSPWYRNKWIGKNKVFEFASDVNTKTRIDNNAGGSRVATTPRGSGLGFGFSVAILDDVLDAEAAHSETELEQVIRWFEGTLRNRANDPKTARIIVIMQRLAENDICGHIKETDPSFFHLILPAEYNPKLTFTSPIGINDWRKKEGELLIPDRLNQEFLDQQKKDPYSYACKYDQLPAPIGGGIIKEDWLQHYFSLPKTFDILLQSWDFSFKADGDYTVGTVWGRKGAYIYLVDLFREQIGINEQIKAVCKMQEKHPYARTILVEDKANGQAIMDMLGRHLSGIIAVNPKSNKEERLKACVPEFNSGCIWVPHESIPQYHWIKEWKREITTFPKAKYDDQVDSTTQAINYLATISKPSVSYLTEEVQQNSASVAKQIFGVSGDSNYSYYSPKSIRSIFN